MRTIKIGKKEIGEGKPCFIIAEAGVNHNGSLKLAKKLVDKAKEAGVDAVKFQTFKAEKLAGATAKNAAYAKKTTGGNSQLEMLKELELSYKEFEELKKYCDKKKIMFLSTPHSGKEDADFLGKLGVAAYKISSSDLNNLVFLGHVARKKKPVILSTGMASMNEIKEAVETIRKAGNKKIILLQCTTSYPCKPENINLRAMKTLKKFGTIIGFSDHSEGILASQLAVGLGAKLVEKHFTLNKKMKGPDHKASAGPKELKALVESIRLTEKMLGSAEKKISKEEKEIAKIAKKSIYAAVSIPGGTAIREQMLEIKRPATGIPPEKISLVVGRKTKKTIDKDTIIRWTDL